MSVYVKHYTKKEALKEREKAKVLFPIGLALLVGPSIPFVLFMLGVPIPGIAVLLLWLLYCVLLCPMGIILSVISCPFFLSELPEEEPQRVVIVQDERKV